MADVGIAEPCGAVDVPFRPPPPSVIILDLPPPISVNRLRKIDWARHGVTKRWIHRADNLVMAARCRSLSPLPRRKIMGQFEITLIFDEGQTNNDLDNSIKLAIDYLKRIELVVDDGKKHMRRVVIEWGLAPTGTRAVLREIG